MSPAHRSAMVGPAPSERTGGDRSPRICRCSRGHAAPYTAPPDRPSAPPRVRCCSSDCRTRGLRRQASLPCKSTASREILAEVDSVLALAGSALPFAPCLRGPQNLRALRLDEPNSGDDPQPPRLAGPATCYGVRGASDLPVERSCPIHALVDGDFQQVIVQHRPMRRVIHRVSNETGSDSG